MPKIKFFTKGDCIFLIILLAYMIFNYFVSEFSLLWIFLQFLVASGYYFLFLKDHFFKTVNSQSKI